MTIRSWTGTEWRGVLLSLLGLEMRVALPGSEDIARLWCRGGQWFAENGEPVELDLQTMSGKADAGAGVWNCGAGAAGSDASPRLN